MSKRDQPIKVSHLAMLVLLVATMSCKKDETDIEYWVNCASCDITYENKSGSTEQRTVTNSWSYPFSCEPGTFLYVSAQNNQASGPVHVQIRANSYTLKEASSDGAYVIATATASSP